VQSLGLSDSTPKSESRIKSLFWPSISSDGDVDYLTTQGFWVCSVIAALTLLGGFLIAPLLSAAVTAALYFLGAMGIRERSRFAALAMFATYALGALVGQIRLGAGIGVMQILFLALLLSNVRAVWLADDWRRRNQPDESPMRMEDTLMDRISDQMPAAVWPIGRFVFYVGASVFAILELIYLLLPVGLLRAG
jgi:hypothetical protein